MIIEPSTETNSTFAQRSRANSSSGPALLNTNNTTPRHLHAPSHASLPPSAVVNDPVRRGGTSPSGSFVQDSIQGQAANMVIMLIVEMLKQYKVDEACLGLRRAEFQLDLRVSDLLTQISKKSEEFPAAWRSRGVMYLLEVCMASDSVFKLK